MLTNGGMTRVALRHVTTYRYSGPASLGPQFIRLRPAAHARAAIEQYALTIEPADHRLTWGQDPFGNWVARMLTFAEPEALRVVVELVADLQPVNPFDFFVEGWAARWPFTYPDGLASDLAPFLARIDGGERFDDFLARFEGGTHDTVQLLLDLNTALRAAVDYRERLEPNTQAPEETLAIASGSCRDSSWLLVALLRRLGIAARFVSGYSIQLANGAEVPADTVDLHAWAEAFVPGAGWIGLDPTSGLMTTEGHIPLAATARLEAAAPVEGAVYGDVTAAFDFDVSASRA